MKFDKPFHEIMKITRRKAYINKQDKDYVGLEVRKEGVRKV